MHMDEIQIIWNLSNFNNLKHNMQVVYNVRMEKKMCEDEMMARSWLDISCHHLLLMLCYAKIDILFSKEKDIKSHIVKDKDEIISQYNFQ